MKTLEAYRIGECYSLERESEAAEPVTMVLAEGVRVEQSAMGQNLLYRSYAGYGMTLQAALKLGWCWIESDKQ